MPRPARPIFTQEWVDALAPGREATMPCSVRIYMQGKGVYVRETNSYVYPDAVDLYTGKARVQPLRSAGQRILPQDNTFVQQVLVSVPIGAVKDIDIRLGVQVRVTAAPLMPVLMRYQYVLQEFMDSGNPIERTLLFTVDEEAVVDGP